MQSRYESLLESCINIMVGMLVNLGGQYVIFPVLGIPVSLLQHLWITVFFTGLSLARSYVIRRWFNGMLLRRSQA
jgi:hypothetical protein